MLNWKVPRRNLQPSGEKAVGIGIQGIEWEGLICLTAGREDGRIRVSIRDNGAGMSREKIREVMEGKVQETDLSRNSTGIGLGNVISRLRLYYNTEHVLEIRSEGENRGTEVILYLPDPDTGEGEEDV